MEKFLMQLSKLEPVEFIGVAHLCGARLLQEDNKTPRDFADILRDVLNKYQTLNRKKRRELEKALAQTNSVKRGGK
jgi:hypothetical protein